MKLLLPVIALAACTAAPVKRTGPPTGIIQALAGLSEVALVLRGPAGERRATTDGCGSALFEKLPAGTYALSASWKTATSELPSIPVVDGQLTVARMKIEEAPAPAAASPAPVRPPERCTLPRKLSGPPFDLDPRADDPLGCLVVKCLVTASGTVSRCTALERVEGATERVMASLLRYRYAPALCDGVPTETDYTLTILFSGGAQ